MHVQSTRRVNFAPSLAQAADTLLHFRQLIIVQFRRYHFHPVKAVIYAAPAASLQALRPNTGIIHQFPDFALRIRHFPAIVSTTNMIGACAKIFSQRSGSVLTGQPRHFHLNPKILVFYSYHCFTSSPSFNLLSAAKSFRPIASMTLTVTQFPACLYACASEVMANSRSI